MGSVGMTAVPAKMISSAQTLANTGRRMKNSTKIRKSASGFSFRASAQRLGNHSKWLKNRDLRAGARSPKAEARPSAMRNHRRSIQQELSSGNDDFVAGLEALLDFIVVSNRLPDLQR